MFCGQMCMICTITPPKKRTFKKKNVHFQNKTNLRKKDTSYGSIKKMSSFGEKLRAFKKGIRKSSVETYLRNIRRLRRVFSSEPIPSNASWLLAPKLIAWYDEQTLSVRRHLATAAIALGAYGKKSEKWQKRHTKSIEEYDAQRKKRTLSDAQKKLIPAKGFDSLKRAITHMRRTLKHVLSNGIKTLSELLRVQDLLILSLYFDYPIRLDYATLKLGRQDKENSIYRQKKKPRGWHMRLVDFKTSDSLGEKTFKFNVSNQRLLTKFVKGTEELTIHGYLLTNRSGKKMSKQALSKRLMKITSDKIGKKFGVQFLRILYAMRARGIIESAQKVSEKLMHSSDQSLLYAKKLEN